MATTRFFFPKENTFETPIFDTLRRFKRRKKADNNDDNSTVDVVEGVEAVLSAEASESTRGGRVFQVERHAFNQSVVQAFSVAQRRSRQCPGPQKAVCDDNMREKEAELRERWWWQLEAEQRGRLSSGDNHNRFLNRALVCCHCILALLHFSRRTTIEKDEKNYSLFTREIHTILML